VLGKSNISNSAIELTSGCFQGLDKEALDFIFDKKTQIEYQKGDTIFKQGAFASHVLYVNKGLARIYLQTANEKQVNIRLAKQGDFMAFSTIYNNDKYHYSAVALVNSVVCMIDKEALRQLLLKNPEFAMQITSRNSYHEGRFLDIIKSVTYKQMRGKLASALLYLSSVEYNEDTIFQYLSRQDIADFASLTLESAVKFLKEFEKETIIALDGKNIVVRDFTQLQQISKNG
jgi:CRP/FNR family transcriptional regulator